MSDVLEKWKERLLDLGKRNRLLNYRDTKLSSVKLNEPGIDAVFAKLTNGTKLEFFDIDAFMQKNLKQGADEKGVYLQAIKQLKQRQIMGVTYENNLKPTLKSLLKKSNGSIVENGINVLYMAFGFLKWSEEGDKTNSYMAPIVLVPVKLIHENAINPYYIEGYSDEIIVNPTLKYKFSTQYHIELPEYEEDDSIGTYLLKVGEIARKLGFYITEDMRLGLFSFLKMNMYIDLKNNEERILKNENVRALVGLNRLTPELENKKLDDVIIHNVVDADSSQLGAIKFAKSGKSFVLQGPPGTGKSQTITNVIAECLADGKKVLFVSEKIAALNVVHNNLKKVALADFCLELHSHKANKKEVIAELNRTLKLPKTVVSNQANIEIEHYNQSKRQLDDYAESLHAPVGTLNMSAFSAFNQYSAIKDAKDIDFVIPEIQTKGDEYLAKSLAVLNETSGYCDSVGYDFRQNAWYGFNAVDISLKHFEEFKQILNILLECYIELSRFSEEVNYAECNNLAQNKALLESYDFLENLRSFTPVFFERGKQKDLAKRILDLYKLQKQIKEQQSEIDEYFTADIYNLELDKLFMSYKRVMGKTFKGLNKEYRQARNTLKGCAVDPRRKVAYTKIMHILKIAREIKASRQEYALMGNYFKSILGDEYKGMQTPWDAYLIISDSVKGFFDKGVDLSYLATLDVAEFDKLSPYFAIHETKLKEITDKSEKGVAFMKKLFDNSIIDFENGNIKDVISKLQNCYDNFDDLNNWIQYIKLLNTAKQIGVHDFLVCCIDNKFPLSEICAIYEKQFYKQWIATIIDGNSVLKNFSRVKQDECVKQFTSRDKTQFGITQAHINALISQMRPDTEVITQGSQVSRLVREGEKKRGQMPVRLLLSELSKIIQTIKPCFLMSPLSVSTYLESGKIKFDTVIFDEASQIFPEDALGAISRGKQVIIVGDSKQMPPTNFFSATADVEEEESVDDSINDFESVLDIASCTFPQRRLNWHYRSRVEELIAFSNNNFYDGSLTTFPSAKKADKDSGVEFYYNKGGVFDRKSKTNIGEAEMVADMVFEHFSTYPTRSIGVVAFSKSQQEEIEKAIDNKRAKDNSFEQFFKEDVKEPFFVKNLETVQGDERDTIIFSIAYAKDSEGKFYHNFGPLNRQGGERRLNVAVTRAKINVKVISSIRSTDIDLSRTTAIGAKLLKDYLAYAENGVIALNTAQGQAQELSRRYFVMDIANQLTAQGYNVQTFVGCSGYKIDIAVLSADGGSYVLGIEADGENYRAATNTRDRDRLRQEVLARLGWKFYRIWSTDWFKNPVIERNRLFSAVQKALGSADSQPIVATSADVQPKIQSQPKSFIAMPTVFDKIEVFDEYQYSQDELLINQYSIDSNFENLIKPILQAEAPINVEFLLKRIVGAFDKNKVTPLVRDEFMYRMRGLKGYSIKNDFIYVDGKPVKFRTAGISGLPREIKYICSDELEVGIIEIIKQNGSVISDGLFKTLCELLGYSRRTPNIVLAFESALKSAINKNAVVVDGENIKLR